MIRKVEWAVALVATAALVGLHAVFLAHAGGLWRDEANSVGLATLPSPSEIWANLQFDSFPALWFVALRSWIAAGLGASDLGLRALGLIVGLGVLGVLWRSGRRTGASPPLVALALIGFNSTVIVYGDSVRGYGLGVLTGLLAIGELWLVADEPTPRRVLVAALAAVASVQCLFQNALLLFAACSGGAVVSLRRRLPGRAVTILGIGAASALSLLPYRGAIRSASEWNDILRYDIDLSWIGFRLRQALEETGPHSPLAWSLLCLLAVVGPCAVLARRGNAVPERERDLGWFSITTLLVGSLSYLLFVRTLRYAMQPWYFLTWMVLGAWCIEVAFTLVARSAGGRISRLGVAVFLMALAFAPVWRSVHSRRTDLDLVAAEIERAAREGDIVVLCPWYYGVTFWRYYRGNAEWLTIPPVSFHRYHRQDLLKRLMESEDAIRPVLEKMEKALCGGNRVFWVGLAKAPPAGTAAPVLPAAPHPVWGWSDMPYYEAWGLQAGQLLLHARRWEPVPLPLRQPVSEYESPPLYVFEGWRAP